MVEGSRYNVSDEQAGINQGILKNKLGYTHQKDLDDAETLLQADAYKHFFDLIQTSHLIFGVKLLLEIHKYFFETLYPWAGNVRTVDISKGEMLFASAKYISTALNEFDYIIQKNTPTLSEDVSDISKKLAKIHNEFNAIHPFRDGNGRTIRLFLDLLVCTLGFEPINYGARKTYLNACIKGAKGNDKPMEKVIRAGLKLNKNNPTILQARERT